MITALVPWATSALTILGMWLLGNKDKRGWIVGLANQALWITFVILYSAWGLLPLTGWLIVVYTRNLIKWRRDDEQPTVAQIRYDTWNEAYDTGVADAWQSMDYDGGRTPAARINPYGVGELKDRRPK